MKSTIHLGDCLSVMAELPENSVDTIVTDPPYGLEFMGKEWDHGVPGEPFWREALRVAKPGAILLAFGGTRTYHRLACAIEDAGWEIRDMVEWMYGSGFPKSLDIGKAIDKQAGMEKIVGTGRAGKTALGQSNGWNKTYNPHEYNITEPNSPNAQLWDGWGTALKPAHEPIVLAMKPIDGTFVNNALTYGVSGLWIDGGRVGFQDDADYQESTQKNRHGDFNSNGGIRVPTKGIYHGDNRPPVNYEPSKGRFPANFIHDGSDEVVGLFPVTGISRGGNSKNVNGWVTTQGKADGIPCGFGDSGSAARFFYCAKASRAERNAGLEGMEERKVNKLNSYGSQDGYVCPDGAHRVGDKGSASMQNHHPTVKPIELMRYLVRLTKTPTGGVVLDPFMGSGTTGIACVLEGRDFIGIEKEAEYIEIAEKRIAHYSLPLI